MESERGPRVAHTVTPAVLVVLAVVVVVLVVILVSRTHHYESTISDLEATNVALEERLDSFRQTYVSPDTIARFVDAAHLGVPASWVDTGHVDFTRNQGASTCFPCHNEVDCAGCHVRGADQ